MDRKGDSVLTLAILLSTVFSVASVEAAAVVTYPSGPLGCTQAPGYADAAMCTVTKETPLGSFVPPTGSFYADSNFGAVVNVLTGPGYVHPYSLPSAFSAHNRYLVVLSTGGQSDIVNATTGLAVYRNVPFSTQGRFWDASSDDIYYYISGATIRKYTLSTSANQVVADYSLPPWGFASISTGGSSDTTKDNWMAFWAADKHQVCAVDLNLVKTYCADYTAQHADSRVGWSFIDFVMVTKGVDSVTGKRYVLLMGSPALGAWSVNLSSGALDFQFRGPENPEMAGNRDGICDPGENCLNAPHSDLLEDTDGRQYLVTSKGSSTPCALDLVTLDVSKGSRLWTPVEQGGGRKAVLTLALCGSAWPSMHVGCAKNAAFCTISTDRNVTRNPADLTTPMPLEPHRGEIMTMRGNGLEVRRLAMSRSVAFSNDSYWPTPRAATSNDGSLVVFDSNFGVPGGTRVLTLPTGMTGGGSPAVPALAVYPAADTINAGDVRQFAANGPVTWSISPAVGTISSKGLYTSPASISAQQTVTVTASSEDGRTARASITVVPGPLPIRINTGGSACTDGEGHAWGGDQYFSGGSTWSTATPIYGMDGACPYRTQRYGKFSYRVPVANGDYNVKLRFAEASMKAAGQRVFNVTLNGTTVLANFDILAAAGAPLVVVDRSFPVTVTGGQIALDFVNGPSNSPMINGIEIASVTATPPPPPGTTAAVQSLLRIDAGGPVYTDTQGLAWQADSKFSSGLTWHTSNAIAGTSDPALYQTCRYGQFSYHLPMANGVYTVTLKFAEVSLTKIGQRVFNVFLNGTPVLANFDVLAAAGAPLKVVDRSFLVNVVTGTIDLAFLNGTANSPLVNAIEVTTGSGEGTPANAAAAIYLNAGGAASVDGAGVVWNADSSYTGGSPWSTVQKIAETETVPIYQTVRYGNSFSYQFAPVAGRYTVTLKFAEVSMSSAGQRVFNVAINGVPVLSNFDVLAAAGGPLIAIDRSFAVTTAGEPITIAFQKGPANSPMVSAIAIVPST